MSNAQEKRRYPRIDVRVSLQGKDLRQNSSISVKTHSKNISTGGVRFITDKFVSLACRLVLELNLPDVSKPVKAISKVTWIKKIPEGNDYDMGSQFLEMSKEDRGIISEFIDSRLGSETNLS